MNTQCYVMNRRATHLTAFLQILGFCTPFNCNASVFHICTYTLMREYYSKVWLYSPTDLVCYSLQHFRKVFSLYDLCDHR